MKKVEIKLAENEMFVETFEEGEDGFSPRLRVWDGREVLLKIDSMGQVFLGPTQLYIPEFDPTHATLMRIIKIAFDYPQVED